MMTVTYTSYGEHVLYIYGELLCNSQLNALNATQPCLDRIVCEHFGDDHRTFRGNLLVRASEIFLVTLLGIWEHRPLTIDDVGDLWNLGGQERCEQVYGICELQRLHECLDIL